MNNIIKKKIRRCLFWLAIKKGAIVIDTKLNDKKITKDFKNLEKNTENLINKYNKSVDSIRGQELAIEKIKARLDELNKGNRVPKDIKNLESQTKIAEKELSNLDNQYKNIIEQINSKNMELEFTTDITESSLIKNQIQTLNNESIEVATNLENTREKAEQLRASLQQAKLNPNNSIETQQLTNQLELMNSRLSQTKEEANQTKNAINDTLNQRTGTLGSALTSIGEKVEDVGKKTDKFKNRITRLISSIAIFNLIRGGLTKMRDGFISLLKTDDQFSASLNQIKANLMTAFAPIYNACLPAINTLMNALAKITGTIAKFVAGIFGIDIKDATKQAKSLSAALEDTSKSGEEASGSLASFDKLEVLQDSSSAKGKGSSGDSGVDYSGEIQYSQTLLNFLNRIKEFVVNNKELILSLFAGLVAGLLALKLGIGAIKSLGIGIVVAGIVMLIQSILGYLKDPTWSNFGNIIISIGVILLGLAVIFGSIPLAIAAATVLVLGILMKFWDEIKAGAQKLLDWLSGLQEKMFGLIKALQDRFGIFGAALGIIISVIGSTMIETFKGAIDMVLSLFDGLFSGIRKIFDGIIQIFKGNFKQGIVSIFKGIANIIIGGVLNKLVSALNTTISPIRALVVAVGKVTGKHWTMDNIKIPKIPLLAQGAVIPPRQEFAAILGDQKHGTNIEAPLETIKQANREVMQEFMNGFSGLNSTEKELIFRNLTFVLQFGKKDFNKLVIDSLRLSEKELGKPLLVS